MRNGKAAARYANLLTGIMLAAGGLMGSGAEGAEPADDGLPSRTALVLFITGDTPATLPMTVRDLRTSGTELLTSALNRAGHSLVPAEELKPLLSKWRVRHGLSLPMGLLSDLAGELAAGKLVVAHVIARAGRLTLAVRSIETASGRIAAIEISDQPIELPLYDDVVPAQTGWLTSLETLCRSVTSETFPVMDDAAPVLLLLPAEATGCDEEFAMMATYCLLQSIVRDGGWTALDPAVVNSALILQGRDPRRLTARGYGTLQEQFAGARILQANLISFSSRRATARVEDPLSGGTGAGPGSKLLDAFNLLVIRVDADTRMITASSQVYDQDSESAGWFGHLVEKSLLHRLKNSARELWGALRPKLEDS